MIAKSNSDNAKNVKQASATPQLRVCGGLLISQKVGYDEVRGLYYSGAWSWWEAAVRRELGYSTTRE